MLEKTLKSPLNSKEIQPVHPKGYQSWIFIHWKDWCWSWNSNTLATWRADSFEKTLMLGNIGGRRRRGRQRMRWLDGITDSMDVSLRCCDSWGRKESDTTERLNWTDDFSPGLENRHEVLNFSAIYRCWFKNHYKGFPGGACGKESACQRMRYRRHRWHEFDPWIRKMPWRQK